MGVESGLSRQALLRVTGSGSPSCPDPKSQVPKKLMPSFPAAGPDMCRAL